MPAGFMNTSNAVVATATGAHPFHVDMDPLIVVRALGELIDSRLVDGQPMGDTELPTDEFLTIEPG